MADKFQMDGHKLLWHLDRVKQWANKEKIAPLHIDLGITTGCNLGCKYCYGILQGRTGYGTSYKERFDMPAEALVRLMKDAKAAGVRSIAYIGEGENTLNPALYEGFKAAKEVGLEISMATNGIMLTEDKMPLILDSLSWIRINISAGTPEGYANIHQSSPQVFYKVIGNIKKLVETKKKGNYKTTLGMQMVITKENMNEVIPLARLGKELGVDYSVFKPCSDTSDKKLNSPDEEYLKMENIFREAESYATSGYSVIIKRAKLGNLGLKNYPKCFGTQFILGISGNGNVFPCGHWFNIRNNEFLMGNVIKQSFKEILKSDQYWEVQRKISEEINVNKDCETNCRQHYINQFLWDLEDEKINVRDLITPKDKKPPEHLNFV
jgi:radical SAM protein with 4Fe4S-binding SPASM domain